MIYLAALGMVLSVAAGVVLLMWALIIRPERRRHATELEQARRERAEAVARVAAEQLRVRAGGSLRHAERFGTVKA